LKFKLDENFGTRAQEIFRVLGHDVQTVSSEALSGCSDDHLFQVCLDEQRCLVTLDLDFSDVTRFPPGMINGIVVIRVPRNPSLVVLEKLVRQFLKELERTPMNNHLWIVEVGRIRIHASDRD
jgi:predicted nuclease of predicted toxin-antitoxin system